jgi:hypothetical protein
MSSVDLESIDIAAYSTQKALTDVQDSAGVKVLKQQQNQQEAIAQTLIGSISETPRAPEQTGQQLNLTA